MKIIDKENMLSLLEDFPNMVREGYELGKDVTVQPDFSSIFVAGMGGSSISGDLLQSYLSESKIPVYVLREAEVPRYVDEDSLVFVTSYSGSTDETVSAYQDALRKLARVVIITSNGKLEQLAITDRKPLIRVPRHIPPRAALPYLFFPILAVLENSGFLKDQKSMVEMVAARLENPHYKEHGESIAVELMGKIPLIYATPHMACVARRWKNQLNENSKMMAFFNQFPELAHNEVEGFAKINKEQFHGIFLREENPNRLIYKQLRAVKKKMMEKCGVSEFVFKEREPLVRLFSSLYLGDWASYFLAIKQEIDPTPVHVIQEVKKDMRSLF